MDKFPSPLSSSAQAPPKPLHAQTRADGWVDVTWALPGLRRAVVAMPEHRAVDGGHDAIAVALLGLTTELDLQDMAYESRIPRAP